MARGARATTGRGPAARTRTTGAVVLCAVAVAITSAIVPGPARAGSPAPVGGSSSAQTVAADAAAAAEVEAPDFASESYSDPWDYSNSSDQNTDATRATNVGVSGGRLRLDVVGGDWFTPVTTVAGSLAFGRDGAAKPIDPARYKRLSIKMDQPTSGGVAAVVWFTCREQTTSCMGGTHFATRPGDNVYDLALTGASTIGAGVPWSSGRIVNLRIVPVTSSAVTSRVRVSVDWLRVYAPGTAHGAWPPGTWSGFSVSALPRPVVDSPNPNEGLDIATALNKRPWDFTSAANGTGVELYNARLGGYGAQGLTATNAGPIRNDPEVVLPVSRFTASRFHHLSYSLSYDGAFSLADAPGGGKLARLIWIATGAGNYQISDDLVTYSGANALPAEIDLAAGDPLDPQSGSPRLGWAGRTVDHLRFDPNEDPGAATWHLKYLHLREDPKATGSTVVKFHDDAWQAGTTAEVRVGRGAPGTAYETIARGVPVAQGSNSVRFELGARPAGSYRVQVILTHADGGAALSFSRTPITMTPGAAPAPAPSTSPEGRLDSLARTPGGVRVTGWARDADTSSPLEVHLYDRTTGAFLGSTRADRPRPDVQAARPGAPLATGYDATFAISSTTPGGRDVCAYGINVGAGANTLLACRSIVVDGRPVGSLDGATRSGTTVAVRGWTLDPDTAASTSVHVYVDGRLAARLPAGGARADIGRAWPGWGTVHGFSGTVTAPAGSTLCVYGIDSTGKGNTTLACRAV